MSEERNQAKIEIKKMLADNEDKIFMGMVHHFYGPLRGLNFLITDPDPDELLDIMDLQSKPVDEVTMKRMMNSQTNSSPENIMELITVIWEKTGIASKLIVFPNEMVNQAENPPKTVSGVKEGIQEIFKTFKINSLVADKDIYFYRVGII